MSMNNMTSWLPTFINFRTKGFQSYHKEDCVFNAHAHVAVELSVLAIIPAYNVLVSNSTTQCHLALSSYRIRIIGATWCCPHTKLIFPPQNSGLYVLRVLLQDSNSTSVNERLWITQVIRETIINLLMNLIWTACWMSMMFGYFWPNVGYIWRWDEGEALNILQE